MLQIRSLDVAYGGLHALSGVSLDVDEGEFVAVVGPNGAGKSTLFKTISGTVAPVSGAITYKGRDLLAVPPGERAQHGIAHVPEGRQVFASMTVMENLEMGAYTRNGRARWRELLPLYLVIAMQLATAVVFIALSRYRLPAVPALAVFAGAALLVLFDSARAGRLDRSGPDRPGRARSRRARGAGHAKPRARGRSGGRGGTQAARRWPGTDGARTPRSDHRHRQRP